MKRERPLLVSWRSLLMNPHRGKGAIQQLLLDSYQERLI
jgi:hypothetical protein